MAKELKFITDCDMGSIKIFSDNMSVCFLNGIGDVPNTVTIKTKKTNKWPDGEFLGHFTVREGQSAYLANANYDCDCDPIYTFGPGRWFVHRTGEAKFIIGYCDGDLHA